MRRCLCLALMLATSGCGSDSGADLENVRTVRSLLAEWALVSEIRPAATYTARMESEAARQLAATAAAARRSKGPARATIAALAGVPADAGPAVLHARVAAARRIENRLAAR
jgi:polygalacturonase